MINITEEVTKEFNATLHEWIDRSIVMDAMVDAGWHQVVLEQFNSKDTTGIVNFFKDISSKDYMILGDRFVFRRKRDAVAFALQWVK